MFVRCGEKMEHNLGYVCLSKAFLHYAPVLAGWERKKMDESGFLPAKPIIELLKENGVKDWEPRVIYQLLELQHGKSCHRTPFLCLRVEFVLISMG